MKYSKSSSSFLEEMHESMSGILQDLFESQEEIVSLRKDRQQVHTQNVDIQKDLKTLQKLCQTLLQKENPPPQTLTNHQLIHLQKHLQNSQEEAEIIEMQQWIHVALKQVEKSLDIMDKSDSK
ncbi:MAG TPA: hypothetical protein VLG44_05115 [Chlamydiales bacterium]|nr:hypothetical protein [Chlamydiales bacterium]